MSLVSLAWDAGAVVASEPRCVQKVFQKDMAKMDQAPVSAFGTAAGRGLGDSGNEGEKRGDPPIRVICDGWGPPPPPPGRNVSPGDRPRLPQRQGKTTEINPMRKARCQRRGGGVLRPADGRRINDSNCLTLTARRPPLFFFDRSRRRPPAARPCANIGRNYYFHFRRRGGD